MIGHRQQPPPITKPMNRFFLLAALFTTLPAYHFDENR